MKKLKYVVLILFVVVAAFLYAHIGKNNLLYDRNVDNSEYQPTGVVEKVEQSFICKEDTLDGFRVKCQIIGDVTGRYIQYQLIDQENGKILADKKAPADEIKNSKFYYFKIDKLSSTRDHSYKIIFKNEDENNGIGFFHQKETADDSVLGINGKTTEGTLIIKNVTERFDIETFVVLLVYVLYVVLFIKFLYKLFK